VADQEGYFKTQGIAVELVPFKSALERDTAMQASQIDGMLNDLISAALLNKDADKVRVVRVAMRPAPGKAMFRLLASPQGKVKTVSALRGMEIGISKSTVIEYVTDSLLVSGGLQPADLAYSPVPDIGLRLSSLVDGNLAAATLPEPMASLAIKQGARPLADDSQLTVGQSVLTFSLEAIQKKPVTLRKFLAAYEDGVLALNTTPAKYNSLLIDKGRVPEPVKDSFAMPPFPTASVPSESEVNAATTWMVRKGLLTKAISYSMIVDGTLLPGK
jgi:NitT/TauT family transport system substrate-binding protein